jgi:fumarate hydratase subunit alpha
MARDISGKIEKLVERANFRLRKDVLQLIIKAYKQETNAGAKKVLLWIIDNSKYAKANSIAICQDTGFPVVFIEAGSKISINAEKVALIEKCIEKAYSKLYLRASLVDPLHRGKPSYRGISSKISFTDKKGLRITIMPKGFGCENKTKLKMFNPTVRNSDIESFVVSAVKSAGPEACPPFFVGVGIGGTSDSVLLLAKKALLEDVSLASKNHDLKVMEKNILKKINSLSIGPMGLGGKTTALAVKIKKETTHIAGLPVGVNISCHALRSASIDI